MNACCVCEYPSKKPDKKMKSVHPEDIDCYLSKECDMSKKMRSSIDKPCKPEKPPKPKRIRKSCCKSCEPPNYVIIPHDCLKGCKDSKAAERNSKR